VKVILVGATGTLGMAVDTALSPRHEIVRVGHAKGDLKVDITDSRSIERLYEEVADFDAVVSTTGDVRFAPLDELTPEDFGVGLRNELMGHVMLVTLGLKHIRANVSFTLTTGQINDDPIRGGASGAMVNGGLEAFARSAAVELTRGVRINIVSPTVTDESWAVFGPSFPGQKTIPADEAALGYVKSVEGPQTGRVYRIGWSRD
jgi:NADP-dependent 3-hydroxy acid dehydrogenase YdfG